MVNASWTQSLSQARDHDHNTDPSRLAMLPPLVADRLRRKYARVHYMIEAARAAP